jgi:hypothetical protein
MQNSKFEVLNAKQIHPRPSQMSGIQIFKFTHAPRRGAGFILARHRRAGFKYSKHLHPHFSLPQGGGLRRGYFEFWSLGFNRTK